MKSALIFGATSAIAQEVAGILGRQGVELFLVGRDETKLSALAENLHVLTGRRPDFKGIDFSSTHQIAGVIQQARNSLTGLDTILVAHGSLPDQRLCESNPEEALEAMRVNLLSAVAILSVAANEMEQQQRGCIVVISSVAGDRGRQSNYVYGAAKGGLTVFLQGLRNRLAKSGVTVVTIKPGFVDTPMTAHLPKNLLFAQPAAIAAGIIKAIEHKRDVVYLPFYWRFVMLMIRLIPEGLFKKLKL
jgi:decaprenylphospho-beta-D-erythro-pentofuranosid-2-ulose 2-reductase